MKTTGKALLLRSTLLAALAVVPGSITSAFAQQAPAGPAAEDKGDVVVVTGSRIARQDYVANSPIVTVGAEDLAATGVTTIDTLLNQMPQFVPAVNQTSNNPSNGGQANISLRGLGTNRTLILMNGRRVVPSNNDGTVDVNLVPSQLVKSVEVVTGGASSTYGSDAIAGVVNFLLRDDFQGLEANVSYGITDEDDGETFSASLATGGSFADGNGHAMLMVSYNDRDAIYNGSRPFSAISGGSGTSPLGSTTFDSTNLPIDNPGVLDPIDLAIGLTSIAQDATVANSGAFGFNNGGTLFDYIGRKNFTSPGGITYDGFAQPGPFFIPDFLFNTGALNQNVLPQKRYNLFSAIDYDINEHANVYTNVLFTQYESATELAASPASGGTGFRVPVSNPFIPTALRSVLASRPNPLGSFRLDKRFTSLGARKSEELYDVYQITTGIKGDAGFGDWTYDAYASYGRTDRTSIQTGNVSRSAVQQLLNATDGGNSLCAGGFNWFGDVPLSAACQTFIGRTSKNLVTVEQSNVEISGQGGLFDLPAGQVRAAVGVAYREDNYRRIPDGSLTGSITVQPCVATAAYAGVNLAQTACNTPATAATAATGNPILTGNDIAGFNPSAFLAGAIDVSEYFGEVLIPVVKDLPFVEEFNVTLGGRVGDYSTVGNISTYKVDFDWTVVDSIRFRGGYQSAVRAPSIGELFAPVLLGFPNIGNPTASGNPAKSGDPCDIRSAYRSTAGTNLAAASNAGVAGLCVAQGVSNASINTYQFAFQQVQALSGGNPSLTEESAKTYSVGLVWTPNFDNPWLENLSASIDYYHMELQDVIGTVSPNDALQQCYNANGVSNPTYSLSNPFCQLITRDPLSGNIINVAGNNQNLAGAEVAGVDLQVNWSMDVGPGTLDASVVGGWLDQWTEETIPNVFRERAGFIANTGPLGSSVGSAQPEWKFLSTVNYRMGDFKVGARWQHIGEMKNLTTPSDNIPAIGYFDLLGSWDISDNLQLRVNVNNLFDELPPTYTPSVQANTDPSTYDTLGRRYTVGLTAKF